VGARAVRTAAALAAASALAAVASPAAPQDEGPKPWSFRTEERIDRIAPSPDGKRLYLGDRAGAVWIHDASDGKQLGKLDAHAGGVAVLSFVGADPALLVSASRQEFVRLWDGAKGAVRRRFEFPGNPKPEERDTDGSLITRWDHVFAVAVARDTPLFAMAGPAQEVVVWDAAKDAQAASFTFENWALGASIAADLSSIALSIASDDEHHVEVRPLGGGPALWRDGVNESDADEAARLHHWQEVEFSPDGKSLLSWGWAEKGDAYLGGMRAYDAATGKRRWTRLYDFQIWDAAYSPAGDRIALSSPRGVSLFDSETGDEVIGLESSSGVMTDVAFSPDGRWLYAAPNRAEGIVRWDVSAEVKVVTPPSPRAAPPIGAPAAAPDAPRAKQTAGAGRSAAISHGADVDAIAVSPDGARLATGGRDGAVRVWDVASGAKYAEFTGVAAGVNWVDWLGGDRDRLAAYGADGIVRCWALPSRTKRCQFSVVPADVPGGPASASLLGVAASAASPEVFVAAFAGGVTTYDADTGASRSSAPADVTAEDGFIPQAIAVSPNARRFVTMGTDVQQRSEGRVFDRDRGGSSWREVAALADRGDDCPLDRWVALAITKDGATVAGVSHGVRAGGNAKSPLIGRVRAWDLATGALKWRLQFDETPGAGALSPRGDWFAVSRADGAHLVSMTSGADTRTLPAPGQTIHALAFSPDGARLYAGTKSGVVLTWSVGGAK
jgi:WD40 repeat protein